MKTQEFKERLKQAGAKQWELALQANVTEWTVCRWLRSDHLTKEQERLLLPALRELEHAKSRRKQKLHKVSVIG